MSVRHRIASWNLVGAFVLGILAAPVWAHGGTYRGPGSGIGPAAPTGPSSGPSGLPSPTGGPGASPSTGGASDSAGDLTAWQQWWALNRDPYLALKAALADDGTQSGSDVFFQGKPRTGADLPTAQVLRERIVPALLALLEKERGPDIVTATLLAIGKIGVQGGDGLAAALQVHLKSSNQEIAETAALALGVLGDAAAASTLVDVLEDGEKGRKLTGREQVPLRTRAFAAYSLGLLGRDARNPDVRRYVVHHLIATLSTDTTASADLGVACVMALGVIPIDPVVSPTPDSPPSASRAGDVKFLIEFLRDKNKPEAVRAYVPVAVARLAGADKELRGVALPAILELVAPNAAVPAVVRQSATAALGLLADSDEDPLDVQSRAALRRIYGDGDRLGRRLALIAFARSAARSGNGDPEPARNEARGFLLAELARGSTSERPWIGLALGILERGVTESGGTASDVVRNALAAALAEHPSPTEAGAYALGLGLMGGDVSRPLLKALDETHDDQVRSYLAVSLGIARVQAAIEPLRQIVTVSRYRPVLMRDVAIGLGLLGDKTITTTLVSLLRDAEGLSAQASIATAIGFVGDASALDSLIGLAADPARGNGTRAFSVVAIGLICDRRPLPWNSVYALDANYWVPPATLFDAASSAGILDIL